MFLLHLELTHSNSLHFRQRAQMQIALLRQIALQGQSCPAHMHDLVSISASRLVCKSD